MPSSRSEPAVPEARLPDEQVAEGKILELTAAAGPAHTVCPTDVARALMPPDQWQRALPVVRRVALRLARTGQLLLFRKGKAIAPEELRGVYRLGAPRDE